MGRKKRLVSKDVERLENTSVSSILNPIVQIDGLVDGPCRAISCIEFCIEGTCTDGSCGFTKLPPHTAMEEQ